MQYSLISRNTGNRYSPALGYPPSGDASQQMGLSGLQETDGRLAHGLIFHIMGGGVSCMAGISMGWSYLWLMVKRAGRRGQRGNSVGDAGQPAGTLRTGRTGTATAPRNTGFGRKGCLIGPIDGFRARAGWDLVNKPLIVDTYQYIVRGGLSIALNDVSRLSLCVRRIRSALNWSSQLAFWACLCRSLLFTLCYCISSTLTPLLGQDGR